MKILFLYKTIFIVMMKSITLYSKGYPQHNAKFTFIYPVNNAKSKVF